MRRAAWLGVGAATVLVSALAVTIAPGGPARAQAPAADDGAHVVGERRLGARMLDLTISSPALDHEQRVRLLLPAGWKRDADRTWPTLWLLHGAFGDHATWTAETEIEKLTEKLGVIVVMPDGGACASYSDWWNGGTGGRPRWETFHLTELLQILERGYRAGGERSVAGVAGGGFGALSYAARHRGLFRAAASFSGTAHILHEIPGALDALDLRQLTMAVACPGVDWRVVWGHPHAQRPIWRQHNPYDLVTQLTGVRLYVSAGTGEPGPLDPPRTAPSASERVVHQTNAMYVEKLRKLAVPAASHFYDGTPAWPYWRRELSAALPVLLADLL
ncbi:alpha/beta hydrolase [Actinocorallia longicatena]|uniref:Alpha/beta hydrolase family protein n=1 Tax=Actinocorallia longicatena TaxID=111803 RepID=A0ABP6QI92_9ACTN